MFDPINTSIQTCLISGRLSQQGVSALYTGDARAPVGSLSNRLFAAAFCQLLVFSEADPDHRYAVICYSSAQCCVHAVL
jgi:hypothetical protein